MNKILPKLNKKVRILIFIVFFILAIAGSFLLGAYISYRNHEAISKQTNQEHKDSLEQSELSTVDLLTSFAKTYDVQEELKENNMKLLELFKDCLLDKQYSSSDFECDKEKVTETIADLVVEKDKLETRLEELNNETQTQLDNFPMKDKFIWKKN